MAEFESRPEQSAGWRKWFWRYDGRKMNWRLDVRSGDSADRRYSDLDNAKLRHYLRIGAIHSDIKEEEERSVSPDRKGAVLFWLVALFVFWVVFRFVGI